jgi:hypothetical protein
MSWEDNRRMLIVQAAALVTTIYAFLVSTLTMVENQTPRLTYGPMSQRDQERQIYLNRIYNSNDVECVNMLRMRRAPFFELCTLLRTRNLLSDSIHSSVEVLYAIGELRNDMIRPPSNDTAPKIMGSSRWYPYLKV